MWNKPLVLDETLSSYHGLSAQEDADMFGIEIELEGRKILPSTSDTDFYTFWKRVDDGSLRRATPDDEAHEVRFRIPLNFKSTEAAIKVLNERLTRKHVVIYDSGRTSVHVHVNCCNDPMYVVYNFITLALIFDELFVSQNGFSRIGNNFCLRAKDAQGQVVDLTRSIHNRGNLSKINRENRYSSVNYVSLFKFGTVEFRSLECTVDDNRLMTWVKVLKALKVAARQYKNPTDIIAQSSLRGPERFLVDVLGIVLATPYLKVADHASMIFNGVRLVQEFAHSATWEPMKGHKGTYSPKKTLHHAFPAGEPGEDDDEEDIDNVLEETTQPPVNPWQFLGIPQPHTPGALAGGGGDAASGITINNMLGPAPTTMTVAQWQAQFGGGGPQH